MIAQELIKILQKNPKLEVVVCECKKYENNIPLIPVKSVEIFDDEDLEPEEFKICLNFDTYKTMTKQMKKFYIYRNNNGIYSVAKTSKCKHYGILVGCINGHITLEDISIIDRPFKEDEICSLINGQHVRIFEIRFY